MAIDRFNAYIEQLRRMQAMAHRIERMRNERMHRVAIEAGFGEYHGGMVHNALVGLHYGRPWPEIDYSLARKVRWLEQTQWEASRIVDRWYKRTYWPRAMGLTGPGGKPVNAQP